MVRIPLARVCDYIHLNPVRAGIVAAAEVGDYQSVAAPYRRISAILNMGHSGSVLGHVARLNQRSAD